MWMVPMLAICTAVHRLARGFLRQCRGSAVPTFAIALVPMVALVGAAVDYSRANNVRAQMQGALDAAVLAGARNDTASWIQTAQNTFTALFQPNGSSGAAPSFVLNGDGSFPGAAGAVLRWISSAPSGFPRSTSRQPRPPWSRPPLLRANIAC